MAGPEADIDVFGDSPHTELYVIPANETLTFEHTYTWWGESSSCHSVRQSFPCSNGFLLRPFSLLGCSPRSFTNPVGSCFWLLSHQAMHKSLPVGTASGSLPCIRRVHLASGSISILPLLVLMPMLVLVACRSLPAAAGDSQPQHHGQQGTCPLALQMGACCAAGPAHPS